MSLISFLDKGSILKNRELHLRHTTNAKIDQVRYIKATRENSTSQGGKTRIKTNHVSFSHLDHYQSFFPSFYYIFPPISEVSLEKSIFIISYLFN